MSKLSEYFSKSTGVETKDTTPTTKVEELKEVTHLECDEEFSEKLKERLRKSKQQQMLLNHQNLLLPRIYTFLVSMVSSDPWKMMTSSRQ